MGLYDTAWHGDWQRLGVLFLLPFAAYLALGQPTAALATLTWVVFSILVASLFFSSRGVLGLGAATAAGLLLVSALLPLAPLTLASLVLFTAAMSAVTWVAGHEQRVHRAALAAVERPLQRRRRAPASYFGRAGGGGRAKREPICTDP